MQTTNQHSPKKDLQFNRESRKEKFFESGFEMLMIEQLYQKREHFCKTDESYR